jgi:hypothetical protein
MQGPQQCNPGRSWLANRTWRSHVRLGLEPDSSRSRCGHVGHEELNPAGTLCPKLKHRWIRSLDIWTMSRRNPSSLDRYRFDLAITSSRCRDGETMSPYPPAIPASSPYFDAPPPQHRIDFCSLHCTPISTQTANPAVTRKQPSTAATPRLLRSPRGGDAARANHSSGTNMSRASVVTTMPHPRQSEAMIKARRAARNIATTRP